MNCEICLFPYDHSKRRPYVLSCPHRFCLDCMNHKLNDKKCPLCMKPIRSKFPNLNLMKTLPESNYDKMRKQLENSVHETNDLKRKLSQDSEKKFSQSLAKIRLQRDQFNKQSNELINLIKQNQTRLLDEFNSIENRYNQNLNDLRIQSQIDLQIKYAKNALETNELDENELINLTNDFENKKINLNKNIQQIDEMNVNYDVFYNKNINVQTGLIAEIKKAEKVIIFFIKFLVYVI